MSDRQDRSTIRPGLSGENNSQHGTDRGQIDPRLIVGCFVLIIIAGPLVASIVDIQSALASTPTFTGVSAAVIALLLLATIVAGILGLD